MKRAALARDARRRRRGGQRGFTIIELLIALAISSILVMMVLSVFSRMSSAYRRQQQVATLQVILAAAQNMLGQDARQAGFQLADGFRVASAPTTNLRPVRIINSATGPDEIRFFSADATVQARVMPGGLTPASLNIDSAAQFVNGELAVVVNTGTTTVNVGADTRTIARFTACVVRITLVGPTTLSLDTAAPWGDANNSQCDAVTIAHAAPSTAGQTMVYRFRARAYRIDPARLALGVLQMSPSGALVANDWQDLGVGFADLQVAARTFLAGNATDPDGDGNTEYNWLSGANMQGATNDNSPSRITRLGISVSIRTDRSVDGVASATTPAFIDLVRPDNNQLGDRPSVVLNPADRIYRYTTIRVDMRNTGATL